MWNKDSRKVRSSFCFYSCGDLYGKCWCSSLKVSSSQKAGVVGEDRRPMTKPSASDYSGTSKQYDYLRNYDSIRNLSSGLMTEMSSPDAASEKELVRCVLVELYSYNPWFYCSMWQYWYWHVLFVVYRVMSTLNRRNLKKQLTAILGALDYHQLL